MAKMLSLHRKETSSMQSMIQIYFNLETDRLVCIYIYNRVLLYLYLEIILFEWFLIETYLIIIGCSCLWFVSYEGDQWVLVVNEGKLFWFLHLFLFFFFFLLHTSVNQHQLSGVLSLSSILATGFMTQTHVHKHKHRSVVLLLWKSWWFWQKAFLSDANSWLLSGILMTYLIMLCFWLMTHIMKADREEKYKCYTQ